MWVPTSPGQQGSGTTGPGRGQSLLPVNSVQPPRVRGVPAASLLVCCVSVAIEGRPMQNPTESFPAAELPRRSPGLFTSLNHPSSLPGTALPTL